MEADRRTTDDGTEPGWALVAVLAAASLLTAGGVTALLVLLPRYAAPPTPAGGGGTWRTEAFVPMPSGRPGGSTPGLSVVLTDDTERPGRAAELHALALRVLPRLEGTIGEDWPKPVGVLLHVTEDPEVLGGYAGVCDGATVHVGPDVSNGAFVHELAHLWFGGDLVRDGRGGDAWLVEGLCDVAAYEVLATSPWLGDAEEFRRSRLEPVREHAGERRWLDVTWEAPSFPRVEGEVTDLWYGTSFAVASLLSELLGPHRRSEWVRRMRQAISPVDTREALRIASSLEPRCAKLAGRWLADHTYGPLPNLALLEDSDGDGLTTARELGLGTVPMQADTDGDGWTDGQEVLVVGSSPLISDRPREALQVWLDGDLDDWKPIRSGWVDDPSNDVEERVVGQVENPTPRLSTSFKGGRRDDGWDQGRVALAEPASVPENAPRVIDLGYVEATGDPWFLYVAFRPRWWGSLLGPPGTWQHVVELDLDRDGEADVEVMSRDLERPELRELGEGAGAARWRAVPGASLAQYSGDVELALPRRELWGQGELRLRAAVRRVGRSRLGGAEKWESVDTSEWFDVDLGPLEGGR